MAKAQTGNTVRVHYTGRLDDGTVFDSSRERAPLEFTLGDGEVIPGFDQAIAGMSPGDSKTVEIPSPEAYGPRRKELMLLVEHERFPDHIQPQVGQQLQMRRNGGEATVVTVSDVSDDGVLLDANHPLAGQDLTFDLQLVEIV